jgi:hypothetical protein
MLGLIQQARVGQSQPWVAVATLKRILGAVLCCAVVCCGVQVTIPPKVAREAVNAEELRLQVNAAFIAGLPQVCCYGSMSF